MNETEHTTKEDATRALLIEMRRYIIHHGILIGECVAWNRLKELYGVGIDHEADESLLCEYQHEQAAAKARGA